MRSFEDTAFSNNYKCRFKYDIYRTCTFFMANSYFRFKQFTINQDRSSFKVGTDGVLLGACADLSAEGRILDVGSGTGLIAIMAAQRTHNEIVALEPDHESFLQAGENIAATAWQDRIMMTDDIKQAIAQTEASASPR